MNLARARWRFLRNASGRDWRSDHLAELGGDLVDGCLGEVAPQLQDGGVPVLGRGGLIGFQPGPDASDHGLSPDAVEILIGSSRIEKIAGRQRLKLARPEVVDDEPVEHGPQVISESPFALVGTGQFAGQELGPELLKNLVGQMLVADFQMDVSWSRRRGIGQQAPPSPPGSVGARDVMGAADGRPDRRYLGQSLFCHRCHPSLTGHGH